jgi:hypothetical protein
VIVARPAAGGNVGNRAGAPPGGVIAPGDGGHWNYLLTRQAPYRIRCACAARMGIERLTPSPPETHPVMIACVIVLASITLLVATEPGPGGRESQPHSPGVGNRP